MRWDHQPFFQLRSEVHQKRPSLVSKWVGLPSVAPPRPIHEAIQSIISEGVTCGYPKGRTARELFLRSAVADSDPWNFGSTSKRRANSVAIQRTESASGPVKFKISGGAEQCWSAWRHAEFASPCQMTFAMPIVRSISWRSK